VKSLGLSLRKAPSVSSTNSGYCAHEFGSYSFIKHREIGLKTSNSTHTPFSWWDPFINTALPAEGLQISPTQPGRTLLTHRRSWRVFTSHPRWMIQLNNIRASKLSRSDASDIQGMSLRSSTSWCFFFLWVKWCFSFQLLAYDKNPRYMWRLVSQSKKLCLVLFLLFPAQMRSGSNVGSPLMDNWWREVREFLERFLQPKRMQSLVIRVTTNNRWCWLFLRISWQYLPNSQYKNQLNFKFNVS